MIVMAIADSFKGFVNRVVHAAHMGQLGEKDVKVLRHLLTKTQKRNLLLSRALLSALSGNAQSEADVKRFAGLLDSANRRINDEKEPFSSEERTELEGIFKRHSLSLGAARKFALGLDELLAMELKTQMEQKIAVLPRRAEPAQRSVQKEKFVH